MPAHTYVFSNEMIPSADGLNAPATCGSPWSAENPTSVVIRQLHASHDGGLPMAVDNRL
jgi:hypothetical protein